MCWHAERSFTPTLAAPGQARSFIVAELMKVIESPDDPVVEDATLILSELVSNAVQAHSDTITAVLELHRSTLHITVADTAPGEPAIQPASRTRNHGRGLRIVEGLSSGWGVRTTDDGKQVWAVVPVPGQLTGGLACTR